MSSPVCVTYISLTLTLTLAWKMKKKIETKTLIFPEGIIRLRVLPHQIQLVMLFRKKGGVSSWVWLV